MGDDIFNVRRRLNQIQLKVKNPRQELESDNMFWTRLWKYYFYLEMESSIQ